ncbi:MAG: hypothetical protein ACQESX_03390 [Bacteroidota bacterium]
MKIPKKTLLIYFINSFSYILLAFFTVFILSRLVMAGAGLLFEIPSTLFKHELVFSAQEEDWWYDSVTTVFFSRVLSYLIIGLMSYIIYLKSVPYKGYLKLYFIWVAFLSVLMLFGEVFFGNILKEGVYHALAWLYVSDTFRLIMIVVLLLLYLLMAILFSKGFVTSANIYFSAFNEYRLKVFFLYQLLFPYLAAVVILTLIMLPEFPVILMLSLYSGLIVMLIILFQTGNHAQYMKTEEEPKELMFDNKALLTALFLMIFYVVLLTNGIAFS